MASAISFSSAHRNFKRIFTLISIVPFNQTDPKALYSPQRNFAFPVHHWKAAISDVEHFATTQPFSTGKEGTYYIQFKLQWKFKDVVNPARTPSEGPG